MSEVSVYLTPDEVKAALTSDEIVADLTGDEVKAGVTTDGLWNWLSGWGKRIKIILDHNDIDAALSNFPHLVYLSASSGHSNKDVSCVFDELGSDANRKKIAITKSDGVTECYVEIDKWDDANEKAWLWVKVPDADPDEDTVLWLYYDSAHADNDTYVGDPSDAVVHNVWDANFKLVSHMRDDPDTSHIRDSTVNANDGTKGAAGEPVVTTDGHIDDAQGFDGINDLVEIATDPSLHPDSELTVECWTKITGVTGESGYHAIIGTNPYANGYLIWTEESLIMYGLVYVNGGRFNSSGFAGALDTKYHLLITAKAGDFLKLYVNGALIGPNRALPAGTLDTNPQPVRIAGQGGNGVHPWFEGITDESRLSNIVRTAAYAKAGYESGRDHLNNFGVEEILPSRLSVELPLVLTSDEVEVRLR